MSEMRSIGHSNSLSVLTEGLECLVWSFNRVASCDMQLNQTLQGRHSDRTLLSFFSLLPNVWKSNETVKTAPAARPAAVLGQGGFGIHPMSHSVTRGLGFLLKEWRELVCKTTSLATGR
jgi:hypothetical protein